MLLAVAAITVIVLLRVVLQGGPSEEVLTSPTLAPLRIEVPESYIYGTPAREAVPTTSPEPIRATEKPQTATPTPQATQTLEVTLADLTFYVCTGAPAGFQDGYCGTTASGEQVNPGVAACGYAFKLGTRFTIIGDEMGTTFHCADRGLGANYWVDLYFYSYNEGRAYADRLKWPWKIRIVP